MPADIYQFITAIIIATVVVFFWKYIIRPFSGKVYPVESGVMQNIAGFDVTPYLMDHSAFDAYAYHVTDNKKSLLYTGDFRAHGRKSSAFKWFLHNAPEKLYKRFREC